MDDVAAAVVDDVAAVVAVVAIGAVVLFSSNHQ